MKPESILILTHIDTVGVVKLPHYKYLRLSNPDVDIHIVIGEDSGNGKVYDWKNSDKVLRNWWSSNSHRVKGNVIAICEWDTLISCELPDLPSGFDLVGKQLILENPKVRNNWNKKIMADPSWTDENWWWFPEIPLLDLNDGELACGLISFGFMLMSRTVIDNVTQSKWDDLYSKSIQNELRFPTIANISGYNLGTIDLPHVEFHEVSLSEFGGIYHGIKKPYNGTFKKTTETLEYNTDK